MITWLQPTNETAENNYYSLEGELKKNNQKQLYKIAL